MQALSLYESSLCPGCKRPMDLCAEDYDQGRAYVVDKHVCTASLSRSVQQRVDEWENADREKRSATAPTEALWSDGLMYAPRSARPDELDE